MEKPFETIQFKLIVLAVLCVLAVVTYAGSSYSRATDGLLHVYFLDVGQGDAIFIQAPDGKQMLIDGGPDDSVVRELSNVMPFYDRSIDVVLSTHQDSDHLAGLIDVLDRYTVDHVIESGVQCITAHCKEFERLIQEKGIDEQSVHAGSRIDLGNGVQIEVLYPLSDLHGTSVKNTNISGVVTRLTYGGEAVLFPADIESSVEKRLARESTSISAQFIKIAHHGSKTSSTSEFLNAVSPLAAFIEVGAGNSYGHPAPTILTRLETMPNLVYYRTDTNGRIELTLDGRQYRITTQK